MNDTMNQVIEPKSDQINADDLIGGDMVITIKEVRISAGTEQPVNIIFEGSKKFYRPCKSMCRAMVFAWGPDADEYVGKSLRLYRDPSVKWGGVNVGGIRISEMSHIDGDLVMALTQTRGQRRPTVIKPLRRDRPVEQRRAEPERRQDSAPPPEQDRRDPPPPADLTDAQKAVQTAARNAALGGVDSFRAWWVGASKEDRAVIFRELPDLQATSERADREKTDPLGDVLDGVIDDAAPTEDEERRWNGET